MGSDRGKTCVCIHHNDFINISLNGKKKTKKHVKKRVVGYEINKDAAIKTFILRVDQMTTWMWKLSLDTVVCLTLWSFSVFFISMVWFFTACSFVLNHSHSSHQHRFQPQYSVKSSDRQRAPGEHRGAFTFCYDFSHKYIVFVHTASCAGKVASGKK